ncbi:unnamed protein product [Effrenium voratum]|uniref:Uncharacterized protein n=1 Tax=Effrenium voratum TaxID=2562239 RepID=A0AA36MWP5_9DINO|nr:unnamed protein product [Effrenium voratum]
MDEEAELLLGPPKGLTETRRGCRATALALILALAVLASSAAHFSHPRLAVGFLAQKFQLLDAWGLMSGAENEDPFAFGCPMTVFQRMAAAALVGRKAEGATRTWTWALKLA